MKITILAIGSRGDVQPLVALGQGLQAVGHEVSIATHPMFETLVRNFGLSFFLVQSNVKEALESIAGQTAMESGTNPVRSWLNFARMINPIMLQTGSDCWAACQTTDAILYSPLGFYFGPHIAEKLNVPAIATFLQPLHPTRTFPSYISPTQRNLGIIFNRFTHTIASSMYWLPYCSVVNQWRQEQLSLSPIPLRVNHVKQMYMQRKPAIYGISPNVLPNPPDWGDHIEITGYWFLDTSADWQPPTDLVDFLLAGPPPVYVGFGSMSIRNPEETTGVVLRALACTKQRGLLATGWGGLNVADLPDNVFKIESIPHEWLFPQMAAVIHHGGAGTTAAGLQAGIPSITVPFFVDQPFWGKRVTELGVGPQPIPRKQLSVERLAAAITTVVSDKELQRRAAVVGKRIRAEDGVARAVEVIQRHLSSFM